MFVFSQQNMCELFGNMKPNNFNTYQTYNGVYRDICV